MATAQKHLVWQTTAFEVRVGHFHAHIAQMSTTGLWRWQVFDLMRRDRDGAVPVASGRADSDIEAKGAVAKVLVEKGALSA
jgi:hypothetical protein